jgi:hypothetical protein
VLFVNGYLSIHKANGEESPLLVTEGDLFSDDWVVVRESHLGHDKQPVLAGTGHPSEHH